MNKIGAFKKFCGKTTMKYGYYYDKEIELPFSEDKKRHVRVWLPPTYDFNDDKKRFPVIYFADGQNLVNKYLTAYGDWKADKVVNSLIKRGIKGIIMVGIDSPKKDIERSLELNPPYEVRKIIKESWNNQDSYADKMIDFIVDKIKPLIDKNFFTMKDKENTAIAGSSMGGIFSFYSLARHSDVFGFSLAFSPAFFLYKKSDWKNILDSFSMDMKTDNKIFLYVGGKGFEKKFVKSTFYTYEYLLKCKFDHDHLKMIFDSGEIHHEDAWNKYLKDALYFWLKDLN